MADYYLGGAVGALDSPNTLNIQTTTNATDFELHISTTNTPTKKDVILFLENAKNYIIENGLSDGRFGTDLPVL